MKVQADIVLVVMAVNQLIFKFCQIWPQPELRRLQGFRLWKKKRHIRSVKNRTDSEMISRGIYCQTVLFVLFGGSMSFLHVAVSLALAIFRGRCEKSLGRRGEQVMWSTIGS